MGVDIGVGSVELVMVVVVVDVGVKVVEQGVKGVLIFGELFVFVDCSGMFIGVLFD